jgi:hypothetical protein
LLSYGIRSSPNPEAGERTVLARQLVNVLPPAHWGPERQLLNISETMALPIGRDRRPRQQLLLDEHRVNTCCGFRFSFEADVILQLKKGRTFGELRSGGP